MGESQPFLIDWLTMRLPLSVSQYPGLYERLHSYLGWLVATDCQGEVVWQKRTLDIEAVRSDSPGLFWQVSASKEGMVLIVGASPATLEHGLNVWGSLDIRHCAEVLVERASSRLGEVLPGIDDWKCSRVDVTANYALPDSGSVKTALQQLLLSAGARRRPSSNNKGGDTVYWNPSSDRAKGKAYHKGPQVLKLYKKNRLDLPELSTDHIELLDRLLRLEHTRANHWFRDLEDSGRRWQDLTDVELVQLHQEFFRPLVGEGVEVKAMERVEIVGAIMRANGCTEGQAKAAFQTYRNCRDDGFDVVKEGMSKPTFYRHQKLLRAAGFTDAHLRMCRVLPFPKVRFVLASPVGSWEDIRRAA